MDRNRNVIKWIFYSWGGDNNSNIKAEIPMQFSLVRVNYGDIIRNAKNYVRIEIEGSSILYHSSFADQAV